MIRDIGEAYARHGDVLARDAEAVIHWLRYRVSTLEYDLKSRPRGEANVASTKQ